MFAKQIITFGFLVSVYWSVVGADCDFRGATYPTGPFETDNPCDHCTCLDTGRASCAIIDCFYPMYAWTCVDGTVPVRKPGDCCPHCPENTSSA